VVRQDGVTRLLLPLLALSFMILGCATHPPAPTDLADIRVHVSAEFAFQSGMRTAVLPFTVVGHPERARDVSAADTFSMELAEAGFVIVDSTIVYRNDLQLGGLVPGADLNAVRRELSVELVALGTVNYVYRGSQSLLGKGQYLEDSASVRIVSLTTGEVVVIATARATGGSLAAELGRAIKGALGQP